jgi:hypothetical protein
MKESQDKRERCDSHSYICGILIYAKMTPQITGKEWMVDVGRKPDLHFYNLLMEKTSQSVWMEVY